ncbi:MAG TPA: oligoendopeptidase F, partial [Anaerolineales bacterium]|nr:oligoendopeptidase F [Anaerolineales bacterium]
MTTPDYKLSRWDLNPLFPGQKSPEMEAALRDVQAAVAEFENRRSELSAAITADRFLAIVQELEAISHLLYRINGFAGLSFTADTQNQEIMSFQAQIEQLVAEIQNRVLFFELWWKGLDDADADRLMGQAGDYRYWLENMRHFKPHTLSEAEEKVVNIKNVTGVQALINLYDQMTNRYTFRIVVDGEEQELTRDELMVYARGPKPELRAAAYQELYKVYGEAGPTLGQIYQSVVRDWK